LSPTLRAQWTDCGIGKKSRITVGWEQEEKFERIDGIVLSSLEDGRARRRPETMIRRLWATLGR